MPIFLNTLPVFIIILLAYLCAKFRYVEASLTDSLTSLLFKVVMPLALFHEISTFSIQELANWPYVCTFVVSAVIMATLGVVISKFIFKRSGSECVINAMASTHVNTAFMALPIFLLLFHNALPVASIMVVQAFATFIILTSLEILTKREKQHWFKLLPKIFLRNPILIGIILGVIASSIHSQFPAPVEKTLVIITHSAAFMALFALGLSLYQPNIETRKISNGIELVVISLLKTLLHPLLAFALGRFAFHLEGFNLLAVTLMAAMPTAKHCYIIANRYKIRPIRASFFVIGATLCSIVGIEVVLTLLS